MKHSGKARKAGFKLILISLILLVAVLVIGVVAVILGSLVMVSSVVLVALWGLFALFTLFFFRDPNPNVPTGANLVVAPAHGTVDVIDTTRELDFIKGECQRVSIFLSVFNVHVQNAPVGGKVAFYKYTTGQFLNALKTQSASANENVLLGFEASDPPGRRVAVRLIAGAIARRVVPFVAQGDEVARGDRIGLIQFGSRVDLYLPMDARIRAKVGDKVVGGETVLAVLD